MNKYKILALLICAISTINTKAQTPEFRFNGGADVIFSYPLRGSGGRAFVHDDGNVLTLNYEGDFTGGVKLGRNFIVAGNGNVGIGNLAPKAALHVTGTMITGGASIDPYNALGDLSFLKSSGQMLIGWNRSGGGGETNFIANRQGGDKGGFTFSDYSQTGVETQLMWIRGNGNVGIGTQDPLGYKLAVNGTIHAKEIKVDVDAASWPDYVFESSYRSLSLPNLEKFIVANKHLPDMPSTQAVEKEGIALGEMNAKLLKKIEELTLYLIEQNKQIEILKEKVNKLQ